MHCAARDDDGISVKLATLTVAVSNWRPNVDSSEVARIVEHAYSTPMISDDRRLQIEPHEGFWTAKNRRPGSRHVRAHEAIDHAEAAVRATIERMVSGRMMQDCDQK